MGPWTVVGRGCCAGGLQLGSPETRRLPVVRATPRGLGPMTGLPSDEGPRVGLSRIVCSPSMTVPAYGLVRPDTFRRGAAEGWDGWGGWGYRCDEGGWGIAMTPGMCARVFVYPTLVVCGCGPMAAVPGCDLISASNRGGWGNCAGWGAAEGGGCWGPLLSGRSQLGVSEGRRLLLLWGDEVREGSRGLAARDVLRAGLPSGWGDCGGCGVIDHRAGRSAPKSEAGTGPGSGEAGSSS
mmetsp:Transcript_4796/g.8683  ORF Transcript_4796/g.8683 Transcript_4796/m.8683 type:complete len:238 (+) Transcript_4796:1618-2331(+)